MLKLYQVARTEARPSTRGYTAPTSVPIHVIHVMGIISTSSSQAALKIIIIIIIIITTMIIQ